MVSRGFDDTDDDGFKFLQTAPVPEYPPSWSAELMIARPYGNDNLTLVSRSITGLMVARSDSYDLARHTEVAGIGWLVPAPASSISGVVNLRGLRCRNLSPLEVNNTVFGDR